MQYNILFWKSKPLLEGVQNTSPILSEFLESTKLITKNIFNLFSTEQPSKLTNKVFRCENIVGKLKKQIIKKSVLLDATGVLDIVKNLTIDLAKKIGVEFFYVTAKKFSKQQSIETNAEFFKLMTSYYGFDQIFIKNFLTQDRDYTEALNFLCYIQKWQENNLDEKLITHKTFVYMIEKFSYAKKIGDVIQLLKKCDDYLIDSERQEVLENLLLKTSQVFITNNFGLNDYQNLLMIFKEKNMEFQTFLQNKILDIINKTQKDIKFIEFILEFFTNQNVQKDLYTYNILIDYNCAQEQLDKAMEIFESINQNGLEPDSFSYSLLIKGLKNSKDVDIQKGLSLFKEYHRKNKIKETIIYNSLLDLLVSTSNIDKADNIFKKMEEDPDVYPDEITFNTIIKGCCKLKDIDTAIKYFHKMKNYQLQPNRITFNSLMDLAVKVQQMGQALKLIEEMQNDDIAPDSFTYSIILNGLRLNNSSTKLVQICLENVKKVILSEEIKVDYVLFNSILDVAEKYELYDQITYFHKLMNDKGIKDSSTVCQILIRSYTKAGQYDKAINVFQNMLNSGMFIKEVTYGLILGTCSASGKMNFAMNIFESLKSHDFNMNSIVFTTILKGFMKTKAYREAISFFNQVKTYTDLPGIAITYNCALDVYSHLVDVEKSIELFNEIDNKFGADMVSYSTIIKTLCAGKQKQLALEYLKKMIKSGIKIDISVVNLYLENCSTTDDYKLAIDAYKFAMMQNVEPNEITFGIMIKIYGFARELHKAFDLLDLMNVYQIKPSIIIFTNLIHISFYNRNPRKAELAYKLFKKNKLDGDALLYSKIIEGLIRFNKLNKVNKYIDYAIKEKCYLKESGYQAIRKKFKDEETLKKIQILKSFSNIKRNPHKNIKKHVNNYNIENPKRFKKMIRDARQQQYEQTGKRNGIDSKKLNNEFQRNHSKKKYFNGDNNYKNKPKVGLFNFRRNKIE